LLRRASWLVVAFLLAACGGREGDTGAVPDTPDEAADLSVAGNTVVRFLQGKIPFDSVALTDTVTLHVAPEGGGGSAVYAREELRDPSNWKVTSGGREFLLVPPAEAGTLTTKTSRHFNCMEYDFSSRSPELARLPHVGTKLEPREPNSCLQSWNLTLVFDSVERPRLVAALYDQWEW
jgi:hypothetical protein